MKPLARFFGAALVGAFALLATPAAQAQVGVNINIGAPAWGPQVPYGTQYYYIPEIDGYYDLYAQQYIVFQDGYWVPLPQLYGYDPYQFHPVIVDYRGPQPWLRVDYYRQRYAYQPYRNYGPGRGGYYSSYGYNGYGGGYGGYNRPGAVYSNGRNYNDHNGYRGNDNRGGGQYPGGGYNPPRGNQQPQPQGGGYSPGPGQNQGNHSSQGQPGGGNSGYNGGGRSNNGGGSGHSRSRN